MFRNGDEESTQNGGEPEVAGGGRVWEESGWAPPALTGAEWVQRVIAGPGGGGLDRDRIRGAVGTTRSTGARRGCS